MRWGLTCDEVTEGVLLKHNNAATFPGDLLGQQEGIQ